MRLFTLLVSLIIFQLSIPETIAQIKGWDVNIENEVITYTPKDLKAGKIFLVKVYKPVSIQDQDLKRWSMNKAETLQTTLGKPLRPWEIKPDKNAAWSLTNMYMNPDGIKLSVGYQTGVLDKGEVYIIQAVMSQDLAIILKYGKKIEDLKKEAFSILLKKKSSGNSYNYPSTPPSPENSKKKKYTPKKKIATINEAIRTTPGNGVKESEIETVWSDHYFSVLSGGIEVETWILFKNGQAYKECQIPPDEFLVQKSKVLEPEKWTKWKKAGSQYMIFDKEDNTWQVLEGDKAVKPRTGELLNARYFTASGSQMYGAHKSWITFKPDGRFELSSFSIMGSPTGMPGPSTTTVSKSDKDGTSSTVSVSGENVGGGVSSNKKDGDKNTGTYSLNGYSISLKHDNGYEHTELFYFIKDNGKEKMVFLNEWYWLD